MDSHEVVGFDSRFYLFAQEMWRDGVSWFPTTYGRPYPDYPASSTFVIYLFTLFFGNMNKLVAVLPTAILAAITLVFTYLIGCLHHKRWGLYAVFLMCFTSVFLKSARAISLDMYPTAISVCCFYLIYSADKKYLPVRIWWVFPLLFISFVFRGPIGLVIPAGVICSYYLLSKEIKKFFLIGSIALIMLLVSTGVLLAIAYQAGGSTFAQDVLRMEVVGRIDNAHLPYYFYFTDSFLSYALAFPLAFCVLLGVIYTVYIAQDNLPQMTFIVKLMGWAMVILIGMSIPGDKKVRYIMPMLPAVALIAAYPFVAPASQKYFAILRKIIISVFSLFPLIFIIGTMAVALYAKKHLLNIEIAYVRIVSLFFVLQTINVLIIAIMQQSNLREIVISGIAVLSFMLVTIHVIEPVQLYFDRARDFVTAIEVLRIQDKAQLVFYKEAPDGLAIKYRINMANIDLPIFINDSVDLVNFSSPAYFITSDSYYDEFSREIAAHFKVAAKGTIGHVPVVVFTKNHSIRP
ncbi:MAG: glycosyltransferase family 39 protein [Gammaproteobacteria bacterium]|nr:glycosyltransferase family 39 protein [Gammaproteobacteria bacterium]MCW5583880.1 glycosyltransferase family 39 protein [Gammaproteobacteria bacterium]